MRRARSFRGPRTRRREGEGWRVRGRIERFGEPSLLLLLREAPAHGYELLERLPELLPDERVDMGNLYRVLRALEEQGVVTSEWDEAAPGPAKRIYELTDEGRALLDAWADALRTAQANVAAFLARYEAPTGRRRPSGPAGSARGPV